MYGAILGDMVGSSYEGAKRSIKTKDFELFSNQSHFNSSEEGIAGAKSTAYSIFLARTGASKAEIKDYVEKNFGYNLNRTLDEIRPEYYHQTRCSKSVPEAIIAFLESTDFEDAIRNAVSLGGDADTQAAIAGSIAEAFYGIDENLIAEVRKRLPYDMLVVFDKFTALMKMLNVH